MDDLVTEYGEGMSGGGYHTWDTSPEHEAVYPLADRIKNKRLNGGRVYRRRIIVIEDWAEVAEPGSRASGGLPVTVPLHHR